MTSDDLPPTLRLFVAVTVPERVKDRVLEAQQAFVRALPRSKVRWVDRDQLHVTLRFLGDVESSRLAALISSLHDSCRGLGPIPIEAAGIGFFPSARRPRVAWAGVSDSAKRLPILHAAVRAATAPFTQEAPDREFQSHITIGRFKEQSPDLTALGRTAETWRDMLFGGWTCDHVNLIRSELRPQGPRHTVLAEVSLNPS